MHLSVITFVSMVTAFVISASRILNASKWIWVSLPPILQGLLPGLALALPALAQGLTGAQSWTDVSVAFVVAGALAMPGIHSHTVATVKPNGPGSGVASAAALALCLGFFCAGLQGCAWFQGSFWPKIESCAPSAAVLVSQVGTILAVGGDYESALEQLALTDGKNAVECAVQVFVNSISGNESDNVAAKARGREFLAKVHQ